MDATKLVVEVLAGIVPQQPMPEYTRRFAITGSQWSDAKDKSVLLAEINGQAQGYAALLMLQPDRLNWVRTDWVWM